MVLHFGKINAVATMARDTRKVDGIGGVNRYIDKILGLHQFLENAFICVKNITRQDG